MTTTTVTAVLLLSRVSLRVEPPTSRLGELESESNGFEKNKNVLQQLYHLAILARMYLVEGTFPGVPGYQTWLFWSYSGLQGDMPGYFGHT